VGGIETYLRQCFLVKRTYQGYTYSLDNTSEISGAVVELFLRARKDSEIRRLGISHFFAWYLMVTMSLDKRY